MKKVFILLMITVMAAGCARFLPQRPTVMIDWIDFVKLNGITYDAVMSKDGQALVSDDLGEVFGTVRFEVSGNVTWTGYKIKDGDAAYLPAGTQIYRVKGYDPKFRVAARRDGQVTLYEADTNPAAKVGSDLLDLEGKVDHIVIRSMVDGSPLSEIRQPDVVAEMVGAVLTAPVFGPGARGGDATSSENRYGITFVFKDGTATTRTYWPDSHFLWAGPGLKLPESFSVALRGALPK